MSPRIEINKRENHVLHVIGAMHGEFGESAVFTAEAVARCADGPCAGSLAGLVMAGCATQRVKDGAVVYALTPEGFAIARARERFGVTLNGRPKRTED